jgi:hypothetical protein
MSQRDSGYERKERDLYETPEWVTEAVVDYIDVTHLWEPAAGSGKMAKELERHGFEVTSTDIVYGDDFLELAATPNERMQAIVTNPPYALAPSFIEHALDLMRPSGGAVAMLLRTDFDHAQTRRHLFADCPAFAKKLVLTRRIRWFEDSGGSPSFNHAWFFWDHKHKGPPTLAYGP